MSQIAEVVEGCCVEALSVDEMQQVLLGFAWAGLRHWLDGRAAGDDARAWLSGEIDALRPGRRVTQDLARIEAQLRPRGQALRG